ncbi:hypothetical protein [Halobacillus karajensis]|uniref:hypothetical protein n=1 Tax=Halobacillus karajensis TaxID=195088 RepID=UPI000690ABF9|nr:hypothetical protein [Halobacillus karajensis]
MKRVAKKGGELYKSIPSSRKTPEEFVMQREENQAFIIHSLASEDKSKEIIILYYCEEFDIKDLADLSNTVKRRLRRGRQLLQERLTSEGGFQRE